MQLKEFYIVPEDVFRVGNATSTLLTKIRGREVDTYEQNGVVLVIANGKGVSVYNAEELSKTPSLAGCGNSLEINPFQ